MDLAILLVSIAGLIVGATALVFTMRGDRRESERADVFWIVDRAADRFTIRNDGRDDALEVEIVLEVESSDALVHNATRVPAGTAVVLESSAARQAIEEHRATMIRNRGVGYFGGLNIAFLVATVRVGWRSESGRWERQVIDEKYVLRDDD